MQLAFIARIRVGFEGQSCFFQEESCNNFCKATMNKGCHFYRKMTALMKLARRSDEEFGQVSRDRCRLTDNMAPNRPSRALAPSRKAMASMLGAARRNSEA